MIRNHRFRHCRTNAVMLLGMFSVHILQLLVMYIFPLFKIDNSFVDSIAERNAKKKNEEKQNNNKIDKRLTRD